MNFHKMSVIGHRHLRFAHPVGEAKIERLVDLLNLRPSHSVVDVGAGKGELLKRLIRRYRVAATALELHADVAPRSRGRLRVLRIDARRFRPTRSFDAGVCIAATHALGGYLPTLDRLRRWVKPGGLIAVGEGFWMKPPAPGYLRFLRTTRAEFGSHGDNLARAEAAGLLPLWSVTATTDEWDEYEWAYSTSIEDYAAGHPSDPDSAPMRRRIRAWRRARLKWGRDTLGFGFYLFRNGRAV